jgi:hypothetical protein
MKKSICIALIVISLYSCGQQEGYSFKGSVKSIERGKDGYTAIISNKDGKEVSATISRVDMGANYKELNIGDIVTVHGDSSNYGNEISVHATKISE